MTQTTETPAAEENEPRLPAQLAETKDIAGQYGFVLPKPEIPAYIHYGPLPYILPANFQWKLPASGTRRRPKKKPARPHYN
jgi:hypothetical protein